MNGYLAKLLQMEVLREVRNEIEAEVTNARGVLA
jgi:hypothetical protein